MSDEEIVLKIQQGQVDEYEQIVKRYEKPLSGFVKKMINQPTEEVEDVVQEILINAYVNIQGFDTGKKFSSWIYRIAHNQCVDFFRKRRLKSDNLEEAEEFLESNDKLIEELEIEEEEKKELAKIVTSLEPKYKEAIVLYYFESKSYEEMADILHIPSTNVGVILFRAKERLKKLLTK